MRLDFRAAVSNRSSESRWPSRHVENRLEPDCWPVIAPSFTIPQGAAIFGMGSCFARNIEYALEELGFQVPGLEFDRRYMAMTGRNGNLARTVYTPTAVLQELTWASNALASDTPLELSDIEHLLLDSGHDQVVDPQSAFQFAGTPLELLEHRRLMLNLYASLFESDVVVLTLGLVETWFDHHTEQYVVFSPHMRSHGDRFEFHRLTFAQCLKATRRSLELLVGDTGRKVLLTTSPIPLGTTFTGQDVLVANMHSKSVLRAVCGEVVEEFETVDYFPSYETAQMTRDPSIWSFDLVHLETSFVNRIMARVVDNYVDNAETLHYDFEDLNRVVSMVRSGRHNEGLQLLDDSAALEQNAMRPRPEVALLLANAGRFDAAIPAADQWLQATGSEVIWEGHFFCGQALLRSGEIDRGSRVVRLFAERLNQPYVIGPLVDALFKMSDDTAVNALVRAVAADGNELAQRELKGTAALKAVEASQTSAST